MHDIIIAVLCIGGSALLLIGAMYIIAKIHGKAITWYYEPIVRNNRKVCDLVRRYNLAILENRIVAERVRLEDYTVLDNLCRSTPLKGYLVDNERTQAFWKWVEKENIDGV